MSTASIQTQSLPPLQAQPAGQPARIAGLNPAAAPAAPSATPPAAQPAAQPRFRLVDQSRAAAPTATASAENSRRVRPGMVSTAQTTAPAARSAPVQAASVATPQAASPARPAEQPLTPAAPQPQPAKTAAAQPVQAPQAAQPSPQPAPVQQTAVAEPEQTASISTTGGDFRWPARGRVIAGFGANGGNEGINIALPEGTPVKAAESGVVTYAGSEVKGYGNLILIRHDNGYVTAYAHNASISVKRGDQVKRGQVIGTSGQTGNVTSPQLHFEIRKGATPVDPMKYLGG